MAGEPFGSGGIADSTRERRPPIKALTRTGFLCRPHSNGAAAQSAMRPRRRSVVLLIASFTAPGTLAAERGQCSRPGRSAHVPIVRTSHAAIWQRERHPGGQERCATLLGGRSAAYAGIQSGHQLIPGALMGPCPPVPERLILAQDSIAHSDFPCDVRNCCGNFRHPCQYRHDRQAFFRLQFHLWLPRQAGDDDLVDATAVEIGDLEAIAAECDGFPEMGEAAHAVQHQSRYRGIFLVR